MTFSDVNSLYLLLFIKYLKYRKTIVDKYNASILDFNLLVVEKHFLKMYLIMIFDND